MCDEGRVKGKGGRIYQYSGSGVVGSGFKKAGKG